MNTVTFSGTVIVCEGFVVGSVVGSDVVGSVVGSVVVGSVVVGSVVVGSVVVGSVVVAVVDSVVGSVGATLVLQAANSMHRHRSRANRRYYIAIILSFFDRSIISQN